jgi:REP element-mobilizing transposase RayT
MQVRETKKHGGRRAGAGRKKSGRRGDTPHRKRPPLSARHPVHVVLRCALRVSMRRREMYELLHRVLERYLGRADFRIVHISIQHTHLHLLVEAADERALSRGMQSFAVTTVRAVHKTGGCGKFFRYRYHATQITTKRYARHALSYVLNNWRRHREDFGYTVRRGAALDPYSSAISFTGWTRRFARPAKYDPLPVSPPTTSLLGFGWSEYGRIDPFECPGPFWQTGRT